MDNVIVENKQWDSLYFPPFAERVLGVGGFLSVLLCHVWLIASNSISLNTQVFSAATPSL